MRTGNPTLSDKAFSINPSDWFEVTDPMTLSWVVNKSFFLIWLTFLWAFLTMAFWGQISSMMYIWAIITTIVLWFVIFFKPTTSPIIAPIYAILEWVILAVFTAYAEKRTWISGIWTQAILITWSIFVALLWIYKSWLIQATENFKLWVTAATMWVMIMYLITFVLNLAWVPTPYMHDNWTFWIIFSCILIVLASLNLVLDFDFIEKWVENKLPKYMEWYASYWLLVTLIWLYIEVLRLLIKLNSRD